MIFPSSGQAVVMALLAITASAPAMAAEPDVHSVANGTYRAAEPSGWDGRSRLPLLLYLHGYGQNSAYVLGDQPLVAAATGSGALLVVPDGLAESWAHVGSPSQGRDDIRFLRDVVADVRKHWPIDERRIVAAGFSQGASMVWDLACHASEGFAAFLPVSGDFWLPYPERCESGPVNLRHIHGMSDNTVPMGGRTIRGRFTQGDIGKSMAILQQTDACRSEADRIEAVGELKCWTWSSCGSGRQLELCLHGDGHIMNAQWLRDGLDWVSRLPALP
jgi:polyhydroxybutyrate depolymerase